jgi:hypothetical protein
LAGGAGTGFGVVAGAALADGIFAVGAFAGTGLFAAGAELFAGAGLFAVVEALALTEEVLVVAKAAPAGRAGRDAEVFLVEALLLESDLRVVMNEKFLPGSMDPGAPAVPEPSKRYRLGSPVS